MAASPPPTPSLPARLALFLKGVAMGVADVIPGVSGGTLALILGIYEELILSLRQFGNRAFWQALAELRPAEAFRVVNGGFLLTLLSGIAAAFLLLSRVMTWLLATAPALVHSFFFGLILASCWLIARRVARWTPLLALLFAGSALGTFYLVGLSPATTPEAGWFIFLSGAVAICAMILPGISGAFILLLLGKYEYMMNALRNFQVDAIALFILGAVLGLLSFAQGLGWLFKYHRDLTLAALTGVMLGSLRKLWAEMTMNGTLIPALPPTAALMVVGVLMVMALERLGEQRTA